MQGIGLNPRGTQMRFVSTRWSLAAAGLVSALALAACADKPMMAPTAAPVVAVQSPMTDAPVMKKKWVKKKKHMRKHKRMMRKHRKM